MTISTTTDRAVLLGNGATFSFNYGFLIPKSSEAVVTLMATDGTLTVLNPVNYTISGINNPAGGTVTYPLSGSPIATGTELIIQRIVPLTQLTSIRNQTFYANVIETCLDYLTMITQQIQDEVTRVVQAPVSDPTTNPPTLTLPAVAQRAGQYLAFDSAGNVIAASSSPGTVPISAAMQPVVEAVTIAAALALMGITAIGTATVPLATTLGGTGLTTYGPISGQTLAVTTTKTALNTEKGYTYSLGGSAYYGLTVNAPGTYDADFHVKAVNNDSRGKLITVSGITPFILWPGQTVEIQSLGASFVVTPKTQRWIAPSGTAFYVDVSNGNDANDGLGATTNAFQTLSQAYSVVRNQLDNGGNSITVNIADGTNDVGAGLFLTYPLVGSGQIMFSGNATNSAVCIVQCNSNSYCVNAREAGCVSTWSGVYFRTTGNGSTAVMASQDAVIDLTGCWYDNFPVGNHVVATTGAKINFLADYTIASNCVSHIVSTYGAYINYGSFTVSLPSPLTFTIFAEASNGGMISAGGVAMNFSGPGAGAGSTGTQYAATGNALIVSSGTTYPGNGAGFTNTGGLYS